MMPKDEKKSAIEKMEDHKENAKDIFSDLDFLDDLPDAPKQVEIPFPYGSDKATPYGWNCK